MCVQNAETKKPFFFGNLSLLIFFLLSVPIRMYPHFHPDLIEGVRGVFLGITIGCLGLVAWRNGRRTRT